MSVLRLMLREAWGRRTGTLLAVLAVALAAGLVVLLQTLFAAVDDETRRKTKDLGFNMVFLPRETNMSAYYETGCSDRDMPEDYIEKLIASQLLTADHFSARLERRVDWRGRSVILTGIRKTYARGGKKPLGPIGGQDIRPGTALVGAELRTAVEEAAGLPGAFDAKGFPKRDADGSPVLPRITVADGEFAVKQALPGSNPRDDLRVYVFLADAQRLLKAPGRINAIEALTCVCDTKDYAAAMREMEAMLPQARADIPDKPKWLVREDLRRNAASFSAFAVPVLVLVAAAWVATLFYLNVRQRREEIGLLRAVGAGSGTVAGLFLGKAVLVGLLGGALGFALGTAASALWGPGLFDLPPGRIAAAWSLLGWCALFSPLLAAAASALPAAAAVRLDPAEALRQE